MTKSGGAFEAFAFDSRNSARAFYVTEDTESGALRRFRSEAAWNRNLLHDDSGTTDYLEFLPGNTFRWTSSLDAGKNSAYNYFRNSEGIVVSDGILWFVAKKDKNLFRLDLDRGTYTVFNTEEDFIPGGGSFDAQPDQLLEDGGNGIMYFTEDGGRTPGIFVSSIQATDEPNQYSTLAQAEAEIYQTDETTGVSFSPDSMLGFFCIQHIGIMFQIRRIDGQPFESTGVQSLQRTR